MTTPTLKPAQITLDTLPQLFAHWREQAGGLFMEDPAPPAPAPTDPAPTPTPPAPAPPAPEPAPPSDKTFTQAELDAILTKRLAEGDKRWEAKLKDLEENIGKSEVEKLTAERDRYKEQAENGSKAGAENLAKAEAKAVALVAGARDDRLTKVIAEADLAGVVGDDGTVDETKLKAAIEKVLTDYPEWKKTPGSSGKELGGGGGGDKPTFTHQQIKDMTPEERVKRLDEINLAMAEGRITK